MDLVGLLDDQWASHRPVSRLRATESAVVKRAAIPDVAPSRIDHCLSDGGLPHLIPSFSADEEAEKVEKLNEALSERAPDLGTVVEADVLGVGEETVAAEKEDKPEDSLEVFPDAIAKNRYDEGLGPAPPLLTALILLLIPLWLPVLAFFLLPLAFTWAFIAGISLITTAVFSVLNRWRATVATSLWRRRQG